MTSFAPLFLALLLNCCGVYIFTRPKNYDSLPYLSYVIFLISVYFLLYGVCVIPRRFRTLYRWAHLIIEFALAMLLMEFIVNNLWYPLELGIVSFFKGLPHMIASLIKSLGINYNFCDSLRFLKSPTVLWVVSYILSLFFFFCIGHATKVLNLDILSECGLYYFVLETADNAKQFLLSFIENPCKKRRKVTFCSDDEDEDYDLYDYSNTEASATTVASATSASSASE